MTENYEVGWWGQNTALWAIVAIAIVIAFLWFCHKSGEDKANLAGSIQQLYGRVNGSQLAECLPDEGYRCRYYSGRSGHQG